MSMRKTILGVIGALASICLLSACASTGTSSSTVTLATAQQYATTLVSALEAAGAVYIASSSADPTTVTDLNNAESVLNTALDQVEALTSTDTNTQTLVLDLISDADTYVQYLPSAQNETDVVLGLAMLGAFVSVLEGSPAVSGNYL